MNFITIFYKCSRNSPHRLLTNIQNRKILNNSIKNYTTTQTILRKDENTKTTNKSTHKSDKKDDGEYDADIKNSILNASLAYVNQCGWSREALIKGAESLGYPGVSHGLFPEAGADLIQYFYKDCNMKLVDIMKKTLEETKAGGVKQEPDKFISNMVERRLRMVVPYLEKWPQAIALGTLPQNVQQTLANVLVLVDNICHYAGDQSVDIKWYSRRIGLAFAYKTSEIYLLQDRSQDHQDTWRYVEKLVHDLLTVDRILSETDKFDTTQAKNTLNAAFITATNMLGIK